MSRAKLIPTIGVDRIVINKIHVGHIDEQKLLRHRDSGEVKIRRQENIDSSGKMQIISFKIIDNERFSEMEVKTVHPKGCGPVKSCSLTLTVHHIRGNNMGNLSIDEYKCELVEISHYIEDEYGIELYMGKAQIKEMEINCTFEISHPFHEYARVMTLLYHLIPSKYRLGKIHYRGCVVKSSQLDTGNRNDLESVERSNTQLAVVTYDKSAEALENDEIETDGNIMRIELRLKSAKKIQNVFQTMLLSDVTDDMVTTYYFETVTDMFREPYEGWRKINKEYLQGLIDEYRRPNVQWQMRLLYHLLGAETETNVPNLLDVRDIIDALGPDPYNHKARTASAFYKTSKITEVFFRGDRDKAAEIFDAIDTAYHISQGSHMMACLNRSKTA